MYVFYGACIDNVVHIVIDKWSFGFRSAESDDPEEREIEGKRDRQSRQIDKTG